MMAAKSGEAEDVSSESGKRKARAGENGVAAKIMAGVSGVGGVKRQMA
jgi:hypothetical protein